MCERCRTKTARILERLTRELQEKPAMLLYSLEILRLDCVLTCVLECSKICSADHHCHHPQHPLML